MARSTALIYQLPPKGVQRQPVFLVANSDVVDYWRWKGWYVLADEIDIWRDAGKDNTDSGR